MPGDRESTRRCVREVCVLWTVSETNGKTGPCLSAWPEGHAEGRESCAGCPRLSGGCYAWQGTVAFAYASIRRGSTADPERYTLEGAIRRAPRHVHIARFGMLGDPAGSPSLVAETLDAIPILRKHGIAPLGYTHHWRRPYAAPLRGVLLASCDTPAGALEARAAGWRVALVGARALAQTRPRTVETPAGRAIVCPAVSRPGVQCASCPRRMWCGDADPGLPPIVFPEHGNLSREWGAS